MKRLYIFYTQNSNMKNDQFPMSQNLLNLVTFLLTILSMDPHIKKYFNFHAKILHRNFQSKF